MAKALANSQETGQDRPQVDAKLAKPLVARRGADDEARAVVSMAYVLAGMIEGFEMALGRRPRPATRTRRVKRRHCGQPRQDTRAYRRGW
jgi:hypothetical protein